MPTTNYIWDEQNYLAESDGTNTINVVYTNEPLQFGNLISTRIAGTTSYAHFDVIGSTRELSNATSVVTNTILYDAWGNVVTRSGTTDAKLLWNGALAYYFDPETGMLYVRARMLGPTIGRWTSVDPLFPIEAATPFVYCANAPPIVVDPSGLLCAIDPCVFARQNEDCLRLYLVPSPDAKTFASIYCDPATGKATPIFIKPPGTGSWKSQAVLKCVLAHERTHAREVTSLCPEFCICKDNQTSSTDPSIIGVKGTFPLFGEPAHFECAATLAGIECAIEALGRGFDPLPLPTDDPTEKELLKYIEQNRLRVRQLNCPKPIDEPILPTSY